MEERTAEAKAALLDTDMTRQLRCKSKNHYQINFFCCTVYAGHLVSRHCGSDLPASTDTSDSFAYVRFVSDTSGNAAGFSLSFEASVEGTMIIRKGFLLQDHKLPHKHLHNF